VTAVVGDANDFAAKLELARARSAAVIEGKMEPPMVILTDPRGPPMVADRRFKRI
jgi:hypothetical protein